MKLIFIVASLFLGFFAQADQTCALRKSNIHALRAVHEHLELAWWAASPDQVWNAPCKSHQPPSEDTMLDYLDNGDSKKISTTVNGISFKDEDPAMIQLFRDLNTYDYSMKDKPPLAFNSKCDKVLCAAKEIFGDKEGLQLLYMLKRHGFNGSALRTKNASSWKANELDDVLTALGDYPDSLYPIQYNRKLSHFTRGMSYHSDPDAVIANSVMEVFDSWNKMTQPERQQTFLHELGHVIAQQKNLDSSAEWYKLAGWTEKVSQKNGSRFVEYEQTDKSHSVSEYAQTNPSEDFAETVVAYRFDGANMKQKHPDKYAYIKEHVFDGKEYLDAKSCTSSLTKTEQIKQANDASYANALAYVKTHPMTSFADDQIVEDAQTRCLDSMMKALAHEISETETCTTRALKEIQLSKAAKAQGVSLDTSLLSEKQLNQIGITEGGGRAFNQMVRVKFSNDLVNNIGQDKRNPLVSSYLRRAKDPESGCKDWAFMSVADIRQSPLAANLVKDDHYYFFQNNRRQNMEAFMQKSCLDAFKSASAGASSFRLTLSILKNMP
ncbi:hypothetical protein [Bdellovibrio svalbardensis]|uniref:Uncharacterized protein n=1 Tax=Bdellovibrio svalbardensis TaxID=2972972 RepID=A0ABT6DH38_9BACT|nr:hypothetical protein [Bdellovibrio svalbardensis]MDG0815570.1 hypothetical protein [Bdellovibrio svalbardensis]